MRPQSILVPLALCAAFALGRYALPHADAPFAKHVAATPTNAPGSSGASKPQAPVGSPGAAQSTGAQLQDASSTTGPDIYAIASYEDLMYAQADLIDAQLKKLRPRTPGKIDLYAVGFAGDAEEGVFRNEVEFLPKLLAKRFDSDGRTLLLINSPQTFDRTPLAMRTNLYDALSGVGDTMDRDKDILLLFLTSHGSRDHQLYVEMGTLPLDQLTPRDIRDALDRARIKWRVIVVSACYSGGFIPDLREPHTMIITAARSDRTSFGCGNDSQITWFGKAFLTEALNHTTDFHEAYLEASRTIAQWEQRDHDTPSEPQFWEGPLIEARLAAWRATLPATTAQVPFAPASLASKDRLSR